MGFVHTLRISQMGRRALDQKWRPDRSTPGVGRDPELRSRRQDLGWLYERGGSHHRWNFRTKVLGKRWLEYWASGGHLVRAIGLLAGRCKWISTFRRAALPRTLGCKPSFLGNHRNCASEER